jgi:uncharacterized protein YbjT (DUF2867 family)
MMEKTKKSALIVGATGLVGNELMNLLPNHPGYETVRVFTRKRMSVDHPKLDQIIVDFDSLDQYKGYLNVDDVFCCLGTTIKKAGSQEAFKKVDFEYPLVLAQLARERGVGKFLIITAMGADRNSKVFYNRVKGELEEELKGAGFSALHIFRPSLLLGDRNEFRLGEKIAIILSPLLSFLMVGSLSPFKPIKAMDVANAMYLSGLNQKTGEFIHRSDQIQSISNGAQ